MLLDLFPGENIYRQSERDYEMVNKYKKANKHPEHLQKAPITRFIHASLTASFCVWTQVNFLSRFCGLESGKKVDFHHHYGRKYA